MYGRRTGWQNFLGKTVSEFQNSTVTVLNLNRFLFILIPDERKDAFCFVIVQHHHFVFHPNKRETIDA